MAFFLDLDINTVKTGKSLFFKRTDKEYNDSLEYGIVPRDADKHDWPTYEKSILVDRLINWFVNKIRLFLPDSNLVVYHKLNDYIYQKILRRVYINEGIKLINQYDNIYSTRLHAAILGILLGKKVYFFDNSYGKNQNFYSSWLKDLDSVIFISK